MLRRARPGCVNYYYYHAVVRPTTNGVEDHKTVLCASVIYLVKNLSSGLSPVSSKHNVRFAVRHDGRPDHLLDVVLDHGTTSTPLQQIEQGFRLISLFLRPRRLRQLGLVWIIVPSALVCHMVTRERSLST